ncbi:MAG: hypothetical protein Q8N39_08355 [Pelolinea sp.]|nr:hypothetical protein [Pelolinea sp.]
MKIPLREQITNTCRHLLSEINRDPSSGAYGCFDRRYWAWKLTDFPEATFQRNVAVLSWYLRQQQSKNHSQMVVKAIKSGLAFAFEVQHRDGSFDQAYPHEHSYGATGFLIPDLITAYQEIRSECSDSEKQLYESGLLRAAEFLTRSSEKHSLISNHLAGAALGLFKAGDFFYENQFSIKGQTLLDLILTNQSSEGWFPEYGGADPGYQTLCMHYLAQIYSLKPSETLRKAFDLSLGFLKYFSHPDGTFGGEYGSRRTEIYYPGGIALLSGEFPDAASQHKFMLASIEEGHTITLTDVDMGNTAPLLNSSILALESGVLLKDSPPMPFQDGPLDKEFPHAGIAIRSRQNYYMILGASNGGVIKIFDRISGNLVLDDCGVYGVTEKGGKLTTQSTCLDNPLRMGNDSLECESNFYSIKDSYPNPFNYLILRLMNLTLMRLGFLNEMMKKLMVSVLVKNSSKINMLRKRVIKLNPQSIEITDIITNSGKVRLKSLVQGFKFTAIHMASARYYTPAQTNPPDAQILDHATLNIKGSLQIKHHVSFADDSTGKA